MPVQKEARVTSKGQVTIPRDIRRVLGVRAGDRLVFETGTSGVRVRPVRTESVFAKYRGVGHPGIPSGRKAINRWIREQRGR